MATAALPKTKSWAGASCSTRRALEEVFTPEDFNEQHQLIAQTTEDFANNEIVPNIDKIEHKEFRRSRAS